MMVSHGLKLKEVESCTLGSTVVVVEQAERRRRRTPRRFVSVWCATTLSASTILGRSSSQLLCNWVPTIAAIAIYPSIETENAKC